MLQRLLILGGFLFIVHDSSYGQAKDTVSSDSTANNIPVIVIEEGSVNQDDDVSVSSSQNAAGVFFASQDPFLITSGITLGQYRFKPRGVDNMEMQVNGIQIQDLERGFASFGQLGGLNDVLHGRSATYGLSPSEYAYGNTNGTNFIDARASNQRKGTNVSYNITNRSYRHRVMATYNSGLSEKGWAYSLSASRRWAQEGYVPGTFYDGYSFYGAVSKVSGKNDFNLTAFASPTKRGQAVFAAIDEVYKLAGDNQYNSAWGYQNGEKRNSKVVNTFQPLIIASHTYNASEKTKINTAVGYEFGKYSSSYIDFYNAYNPNPDYYRNLPSYYLTSEHPMPSTAEAVRTQLLAHPEQLQMDWTGMYNANYINNETVRNVNGTGDSVSGRRSMYVVSNRVDDMKKFSFNSALQHAANSNVSLFGGLRFVMQDDRYFKQVDDLLGGDFFLNYNQFANQTAVQSPDFVQNDLNKPNRVIKKGDVYGYDYSINIKESDAWGQATFTYDNVDFFVAANGGYTTFSRTGYMRNGLFADHSFGKSEAHNFLTYKTKGGLTWKVNSRNHLYLNGDITTEAPKPSNAYIAARNRDYVVNNLTTQKSNTIEGGYLYKSSTVFMRLSGYVTEITDATVNKLFFNDDPAVVSFVNYILQNMNSRALGTEFSGNVKISESWNVTGLASVGQFYYTNNPTVTFYFDNQPLVVGNPRKVYMKNYYVASGPQSVYSIAANYRSKKNWSGRVNFNYTDNNYVDINPDRHTQDALDLVPANSPVWNKIVTQEKLPSAFTVDINGSKAININRHLKKLKHPTQVFVSAGIVNVLNNKNIKVSGYEQLRYDYELRNPDRFPTKYDYAFGLNYYATISLRF